VNDAGNGIDTHRNAHDRAEPPGAVMTAQPTRSDHIDHRTGDGRPALDALYETDYVRWLFENAALLRAGRLEELDRLNIAEELEDMGRSEARAMGSHIEVLLLHLLEWQFQPDERGNSWRGAILNARYAIADLIGDSPSLRNRLPDAVMRRYPRAVKRASAETGLPEQTFPAACPYAIEDLLRDDHWPD
jgi:hypothetical protein